MTGDIVVADQEPPKHYTPGPKRGVPFFVVPWLVHTLNILIVPGGLF